MSKIEGNVTFTAGEDLECARRVKVKSGTATIPPEVEYADAGEQHIGVTDSRVDAGELITILPINITGTIDITAAAAYSVGADVYGAIDGKISGVAVGSVIGVAKEAATSDGEIVEVIQFAVLSTVAGTTSIADAGGFTSASNVEAALQELYQDAKNTQASIPVALTSVIETDGTNMIGLLGPATTPVLDLANGDTDSGLQINWVAGNSDAILFQAPLPPDLDDTGDVVIHFRATSGATDTPVIDADSYFNEGDTKVEDASSALGSVFAENTIIIDAADVPSGAQTLSTELTPGAHATDAIIISAIWVEYKRTILTS